LLVILASSATLFYDLIVC